MFRSALIIIMTMLLSVSCSLASFEALYDLTSRLKENIAVETGVVSVDSAELINEVYPDAGNTEVLEEQDGMYSFDGIYILDLGFSCATVLAPLEEKTMNSLINASENSIKKKDLARALASEAEEPLGEYAENTAGYLESFIQMVREKEEYSHLADLLESFIPDDDGTLTSRDVLDLRIIMYVVENALSYFDHSIITCRDVFSAFESAFTGMETDFVDIMADALGKAKSACSATGSQWLWNALNSLLLNVLEDMR